MKEIGPSRGTGSGGQVMQIPVLVEVVDGNGYRARSGEPFPLCAEGKTHEEAVRKLRKLIEDRLAAGARLVTLEIPTMAPNPWVEFAGMFKDNPEFDEWQKAIAENR